MKRLDGTPYETVWGGTSLDLTNPNVKEHLLELARTLHGWGFNYFKMDGLWTGSVTSKFMSMMATKTTTSATISRSTIRR